MSNMSYCRFENTARDLYDCTVELCDTNEEQVPHATFLRKLSSDQEREAVRHLYDLCKEFIEEYEELIGDVGTGPFDKASTFGGHNG